MHRGLLLIACLCACGGSSTAPSPPAEKPSDEALAKSETDHKAVHQNEEAQSPEGDAELATDSKKMRAMNNVRRSASRYGYTKTPLTPLADKITALAEAALAGKPLPAAPFPVLTGAKIDYRNDRPSGALRWKLFFMEVKVAATTTSGKFLRMRLGLLVGPEGLRLVEGSAYEEESQDSDIVTELPRPVADSVKQVIALLKAGESDKLVLTEKSLIFIPDPTMRLELVKEAERKFKKLEQSAGDVASVQGYGLDDIGLMGIDDNGKLFTLDADLDFDKGTQTFVFDDEHLFRVRPLR
jgi:hypothetical protein